LGGKTDHLAQQIGVGDRDHPSRSTLYEFALLMKAIANCTQCDIRNRSRAEKIRDKSRR
jgi:hypothetical protein